MLLNFKFQSGCPAVSPALLLELVPFNTLSEEERIVIANESSLVKAKKGFVLTRLGEEDCWDYYLIEGTLRLEAEDGKVLFLEGGSTRANAPIAHLQPRKYKSYALTPITYLQVNYELTKNLFLNQKDTTVDIKEQLKENPLYIEVADDIAHDALNIPTMPEIAVTIRNLVEDPEADITKIAQAVQVDPGISAKLIKTANGALYHGQKHVDTCLRAITRLGMNTTKDLVTSFVMYNLFTTKVKSPKLRAHIRKLWEHSIDVAAICRVLGQVTPGLDAEEALLIGLLHDIGELVILTYAEKYPRIAKNHKVLGSVIFELKGEIGSSILKKWRFPEELLQVPVQADNWYLQHPGPADYSDVVVVAHLHNLCGSGEKLPSVEDIPAFSKVADGKLDPNLSLQVVDRAKELIKETRQLFCLNN